MLLPDAGYRAGMILIILQHNIFQSLKLRTMNNKLWALALVGAAAYLFKTKKGAELRQNLTKSAGGLKTKLTDMYQKSRQNGQHVLDTQMS